MNRLQDVVNRLQALWKRAKEPWKIASQYRGDISYLDQRIEEVHRRLGEHTVIHADIHYKEKDMIIAVGRYRNRDYVRCFYVDPGSFIELVEMLKQIEPHARVGHFDIPHSLPFSVVYEMDRF